MNGLLTLLNHIFKLLDVFSVTRLIKNVDFIKYICSTEIIKVFFQHRL
jgi:hypothetical protein